MPKIKIAGIGGIRFLVDIMFIISRNDHETQVRDVSASLQARDVLEYIIAVFWFAMVGPFEEFQFQCASPFLTVIGGETKPDIDAAALSSRTVQRFLQLYRECLTLAGNLEVSDGRDDTTKVKLKRRFAFTPDPTALNLSEKRKHGCSYDIAKALN